MKLSVQITLKSGWTIRLAKTYATQEEAETGKDDLATAMAAAGNVWHISDFDDSIDVWATVAEIAAVKMGIWE